MFGNVDCLDPECIRIVQLAINEGRIGRSVQPVFNVEDSQSILYNECFARLYDAQGNAHGASMFMPTLEAFGESPLIDRHILQLVLDELDRDPSISLGCNLSADNFKDLQRYEILYRQIAARAHLAPRLVLEVTETREISNLAVLCRAITDLRELGCKFALDDFGTGYSSPHLLAVAKFDIVKVDRFFVQSSFTDGGTRDALAHIVNFASCYVPAIVVEGIETPLHAARARSAGATHLQGYLLSIPVPAGNDRCMNAHAI
ncbi:EAL domain-containing protein [Ochrobactrum sp. BTU1]|uniref:EAL domain-containing protein n=1 Tax=Ochrobactrum sp. BTU1 TaxID=2840456 RepID=UPI001C050D12|nr:EAL domain-containing protein [Ochrobactrum sp. BTU1]